MAEKRRRIVLAVMLLLSIVNFNRLSGNESIRAIQFLSIFIMGALAGLLLNEFIMLFKAKRS
ncbi:MAG: hypothetical protein ACKVOW_02985 [Chitinophagaceae bacterium]